MSEISQGVPVPIRENPVTLPRCRCLVVRRDYQGPEREQDRCQATVTDPDSPLCKPCEIEHQDHQDPEFEYRLVPLI